MAKAPMTGALIRRAETESLSGSDFEKSTAALFYVSQLLTVCTSYQCPVSSVLG